MPWQLRCEEVAEDNEAVVIGCRLIPNPFVTFTLLSVGMIGAFGVAAGTAWGTFDGAATYVLWVASGVLLLVLGGGAFYRTTAVLGDGRVRSGWPQSRWWNADAVIEVRATPGGASEIRARNKAGRATTLIVVVPGFLGLFAASDRTSSALGRIRGAMDPVGP